MTVYLLGTLDTKGREIAYVQSLLKQLGVKTTVVDTGCLGQPTMDADISREAVFQAADTSLEEMISRNDRGTAVTNAAKGTASLVNQAFESGTLQGVLALGGSAGTTIGTEAMRTLPLGIPKLMVSTLASGQVRPYVGGKDIFMLNSVVDIAGINRISREVLNQAARAMAGMVLFQSEISQTSEFTERPLIAASMFGVTTPCLLKAQEVLEGEGFEVLIFHATGTGGEAMEGLIWDGLIAGVLDITTTELADELVGGILSAGPSRLTAASKRGIPQVISVGATDMVNFGAVSSVPEKFKDRLFYEHNATVTLMRTTEEECKALGHIIAEKANRSCGPVSVLLPLQGVSAIDKSGEPFDSPAARNAMFDAIREHRESLEILEYPHHINDEDFAIAAARKLIELISSQVE